MILGMNNEAVIRHLVSDKIYEMYINRGQVDLGSTVRDVEGFKLDMQTVFGISALIMRRALEYTPVDTGKLRESIYIKRVGSGMEIGYTADYATYVHEIGFYNHKAPTKYKYLEDAALEVGLETKSPYRISISYDPLAVYINVPDKGENLIGIKYKEDINRSLSVREQAWNEYANYDESTATPEQKVYMGKMAEFFRYWETRGYNSDWILDEWQDRNRHS